MTTKTHRWTNLQQAMATLSAACDYAHEKDDAGFSSADATLGHYLGDSNVNDWDASDADVAATFATTYKRQLGISGFRDLVDEGTAAAIDAYRTDLHGIDDREEVRLRAAAKRSADKVAADSSLTLAADLVVLATPYNDELVAAQRAIPGRRWDGSANTFPLTSLPQVIGLCDKFAITVTDDLRATAANIEADADAYTPVAVTLVDHQLVIEADYNPYLNAALRGFNGSSTWDRDSSVHRINPAVAPSGLRDLFAEHQLKVAEDAAALLAALADVEANRAHVELETNAYGVDSLLIHATPADLDNEQAVADELIAAAGGTGRYPYEGMPARIRVSHSPDKVLAILDRYGFTLSIEARAALEAEAARQAENLTRSIDDGATTEPVVIDDLGITLMPHQNAAVRYLSHHRRAIVADDMGLGKTYTSLATIAAEQAFPAVVVCKPDLIGNWTKEINTCLPDRTVYVAEGMTSKPIPDNVDIILIGFNALGAIAKNPRLALDDTSVDSTNAADVADIAKKVATRLDKSNIDHRNTDDVLIVQTEAHQQWKEALATALPNLRVRSADLDNADIIVIPKRLTKNVGKKRRHAWIDTLTAQAPEAFIIDEGHFGKEATANRSQGMELLGRDVATRDGIILNLTGTAIVNRPKEIAQQLVILGYLAPQGDRDPANRDKYLFGEFGAFLYRYCGPQSSDYGWTFNGASHLDELHTRLRAWGLYLRRRTDILHNLPDFTMSEWLIDPADLDQATYSTYLAHEAQTVEDLRAAAQRYANARGIDVDSPEVKAAMVADAPNHLAEITKLRQIIGEAKTPAIAKWVTDKNAAGEKVMVAAHFRPVVSGIADRFGGLRIQGEQTVGSKEADKARFQEASTEEAPVISVSIAAGGVGHTLTAARYGIQAEQVWTPGEVNQMAKRIYRIGQTRDVDYTIALVPGTIDERMWKMINDKQAVVSAVLDGEDGIDDLDSTDAETTALGEVIWDYVINDAPTKP